MRYDGIQVLERIEQISNTYADIFTQPPWNKAHDSDHEVVRSGFHARMLTDTKRPGFRVIVAESGNGIDGFASGWITGDPFRGDRAYPKVESSIGAERTARLLIGGLEVDELAVRSSARGQGLGRRLLSELIAEAPQNRAWLLTWTGAPDSVEFYRRTGWHRVPVVSGADNDIVTYLAPHHPDAQSL